MGLSTFFLIQAGLSTDSAFTLSIGQYAMGIVGTASSWFLMRYIGRRTLYFWGLVVLACVLVLIGVMGCINSTGAQCVPPSTSPVELGGELYLDCEVAEELNRLLQPPGGALGRFCSSTPSYMTRLKGLCATHWCLYVPVPFGRVWGRVPAVKASRTTSRARSRTSRARPGPSVALRLFRQGADVLLHAILVRRRFPRPACAPRQSCKPGSSLAL